MMSPTCTKITSVTLIFGLVACWKVGMEIPGHYFVRPFEISLYVCVMETDFGSKTSVKGECFRQNKDF